MRKKNINEVPCSGCGQNKYTQHPILWDELISAWGLTNHERNYIDKQQGYSCDNCGMNLRSRVLASSLMNSFEFSGNLASFCAEYKDKLRVLEVNEAGSLHQYLGKLNDCTLTTFPAVDIRKLPFKDGVFDVVIHSDTLEHVKNPTKGIKECYRVLKKGGLLCYTVPVVVDRMTRNKNLATSYHGTEGDNDYLVTTEYGADFWTELFDSGFDNCTITGCDYPAGIAISARKTLLT